MLVLAFVAFLSLVGFTVACAIDGRRGDSCTRFARFLDALGSVLGVPEPRWEEER